MGEKEIKHAEEREEEREIRAGSRAEQCSADERGSVCGGGVSKHALHVIQSVHMPLCYAFINT